MYHIDSQGDSILRIEFPNTGTDSIENSITAKTDVPARNKLPLEKNYEIKQHINSFLA